MAGRSDVGIVRRAESQHGVFTLDEARAAGASRWTVGRQVRAGRFERVEPSTYRVVGAPGSWRSGLSAAVRSAGERAVASHRCAACLWNLDGSHEGPLEISVPNTLVRPHLSAKVYRVTVLEDRDRTTIDSIPVTSIERTIIDLAAVLPLGGLAHALDSALVEGLTTVERVRRRQHRLGRRGRKGAGRLAMLLMERDGRDQARTNGFERRLVRALVRAGLPDPIPQFEVRDRRGVLVARPDFAYPDARLAIEADSYRWHGGRLAFDRDLRRRNRLTALGWRIVHVSWTQLVRNPASVVTEVSRMLGLSDL